MDIKNNNIFQVPDLNPMYEAIKAFVKDHQGHKGFINTDDPNGDAMYSLEYSQEENRVNEYHIKGIRVNRHNCLEVITDLYNVRYSDDDIHRCGDSEWLNVRHSDEVYFVPTIFNIAEALAKYVEDIADIPERLKNKKSFEYLGRTFIGAGTFRQNGIKNDFKDIIKHTERIPDHPYVSGFDYEQFYETARKAHQYKNEIFWCIELGMYLLPTNGFMHKFNL